MPMTPVFHPSGCPAFGMLEEMRAPGLIIPSGEILLFRGRHTGPNRGFGVEHIWSEHAQEMCTAGFNSYDETPTYVATIIRQGTPVFFGDHSWRSLRVMAVRSKIGTAIVEFRQPREASGIWSIVTAFSGTRTHGTRVGTVR
jgi:hypothetical protein